MPVQIRDAHPTDLPDLYRICRQTSGGATSVPPPVSDPDLVGHVFVAPYLFFEPRCCLVAQAGTTLLGYVVGTSDTRGFAEWMESKWLPAVRERIPSDIEPLSGHEGWLREIVQSPDPVPAFAADYPAHLHINLLPQARSTGLGRNLIQTLLLRLTESDISGIHIGVARANEPAIGFYRAMGFDTVLAEDSGGLYLGRTLSGLNSDPSTVSA